VEFRAISKIVITASSAPSSGGVREEDLFGPLKYKSRSSKQGL